MKEERKNESINQGLIKTREWLLIILTLMLIQAAIHYLSRDYSGSSKALEYVSFAGTIVSTMLGLIAIIYAFVQSITNTTAVAEIRSQVNLLIKAGESISRQEKKLEKSVSKIGSATSALGEKLKSHTEIAQTLSDQIQQNSEQYVVDDKKGSEDGGKEDESNGNTSWLFLELVRLMIYDIVEHKLGLHEFNQEVVKKLPEDSAWRKEFIAGGMAAVSMDLDERGLIIIDKGKKGDDIRYIGLPGFKKYITPLIADTDNSKVDEFKSYKSLIEAMISQCSVKELGSDESKSD